MIKMSFDKELLKRERIKKGMSQQELADVIGVKEQSIYNWESGTYEPCEENIVSLSHVFNMDITCFLIKEHIEPKKKRKINHRFIRDLRLKYKYSQEEFGSLLDINKTTISKWESGKKGISKKNLQKIAELFNINVEELYEKGGD